MLQPFLFLCLIGDARRLVVLEPPGEIQTDARRRRLRVAAKARSTPVIDNQNRADDTRRGSYEARSSAGGYEHESLRDVTRKMARRWGIFLLVRGRGLPLGLGKHPVSRRNKMKKQNRLNESRPVVPYAAPPRSTTFLAARAMNSVKGVVMTRGRPTHGEQED